MSFFRDFLGIQEQEEIIEARVRPDPGRVNLAHCRSLGPSYRHLPKRDQNKTCKGRDGMCYEVLNDVWASHPTWASEDSGFVAHRKNQHEEALHRIEEERHDYDFHIESCQRTIQLMEPLVHQIRAMSDADRAIFQLSPTLGGASEAIPKRIIMKIYGREVGGKVLTELFQRPTAVLPIVLARLKQKLEEWKATQREWEKVWRDQINKQFWKSLDHQGIGAKLTDKKVFMTKTLTSEIATKYEEGKKNRENGNPTKKHQLEYTFTDVDVMADAARLVMNSVSSDRANYNSGEIERIRAWFLDFIPRFFGLNAEQFVEQVHVDGSTSRDEEMQDGAENDSPSEVKPKHNKSSLLRKALDRRNGKDDSASASKESTPIPTTEHDMDIDEEQDESVVEDSPQPLWINHVHADMQAHPVSLEETYPHTTFNLYANANIYCFFRLFQYLYVRLLAIKTNESVVVEAVHRYLAVEAKKPAIDLRMIDKGPEQFFSSINAQDPYHYYNEILRMIEDVIKGVGEQSHLEETLRRYYNKNGWQLYTIEKLVSAIVRFVMNILGGDAKDKSVDITNMFFRDREKPDTTRGQEIQYRKMVERYSKDGEVYRISYVRRSNRLIEYLC
jgi:paired amphipathic helix protein Sin3a